MMKSALKNVQLIGHAWIKRKVRAVFALQWLTCSMEDKVG